MNETEEFLVGIWRAPLGAEMLLGAARYANSIGLIGEAEDLLFCAEIAFTKTND